MKANLIVNFQRKCSQCPIGILSFCDLCLAITEPFKFEVLKCEDFFPSRHQGTLEWLTDVEWVLGNNIHYPDDLLQSSSPSEIPSEQNILVFF